MQTNIFKIKDDKTGMVVSLKGSMPPPEQLPSVFAGASKRASELLSSGDYRYEGMNELSKDQQYARLRKLTAQALRTSEDEIDVDNGAGFWERAKLNALPDETSRMDYMEKKYGSENVAMLDVGGKPKMFYRDPKTKKMTMVDEQGLSLSDFTADLAGAVAPTAAAVGGAIKGAAIGAPLGPVGMLAGGVIGAAGAGFAAGVTQDVAAQALAGQEIRGGDILAQRGKEAVIGAGLDVAMAGFGRFGAKLLSKAIPNATADAIAQAQSRLGDAGFAVERSAAMEIGEKAMAKEATIAAKFDTGKVAQIHRRNLDTLGQFKDAAEGIDVDTSSAFAKTIQAIQSDAQRLVDDIAMSDRNKANIIDQALQRKIERMQVEPVSFDDLGMRMQSVTKQGESAVMDRNAANWSQLDIEAPRRNVSTTAAEVSDTLRKVAAKNGEFKQNPAVNQFIADMAARGDEVIPFKDLRNLIEKIQDMVPSGGATGGKVEQQVAAGATAALRELRDGLVRKGGKDFAKLYDQTMDFYKSDVLRYKRGAVGGAIKEQFGDFAKTGTDVVDSVLSDPANIRNFVQAIKAAPSAESASMIRELRDAYMYKIGLGTDVIDPRVGIRFNPEVVRELYGFGSDGVFRASHGQRKVDALNSLNKALKETKGARSIVDAEDVSRLLSTLTENEQKSVIREIAKKSQAEAAQNEALSNALWKKVAQGKYEYMDNPEFARAAYQASPQDIRNLLKKAPKEFEEPFRQDFTRHIFSQAKSGSQMTSSGRELWNPATMDDILNKKRGQIEAALGKDGYLDLKAANEIAKASSIKTRAQADIGLRAVGGASGFQFYLAGPIASAFSDRFMSWAYASKAMRPLLKVLNKDVAPAEMEKNFRNLMLKMIGSRAGAMALARESDQDPNFKVAALDLISQTTQSEQE